MTFDLVWVPLAGALVGFIVGLTGVGGGALMAPILLLGFGLDLQTVVATDLLFATITKLVASGMHLRNQLVDWQIVKRLWLGSLPATIIIIMLANQGYLFESAQWIINLLGFLILFSGLSLVFGHRLQLSQRAKRLASPNQFKLLQAPFTILSGGMLGTLITMTSVGAGALGAVFLRALYPLRMQPRPLVATDTIHAIPVSLIGGISFLLMGYTELKILGLLLLGSIPMAVVGSSLVKTIPINVIKLILALTLTLAGIKLISS